MITLPSTRKRAAAWTAAILSIYFCGSTAAGQATDANRQELYGVVRALDGSPVAGALVEAWLRPAVHYQATGVSDHVQAESDRLGRFRVLLLRGYPYSCAATWKAGATRAQTRVRESVYAGSQLRLEESPVRVGSCTVRVRSTQKSRMKLAGARLRVVVPGNNPRVLHDGPLEITDGGETNFDASMTDARGKLFFEVTVNDRNVFGREGTLDPHRDFTIDLRAYTKFELLVVDEGGQPVSAARVRASIHYPTPWALVARGRADGRTEVLRFPTTKSATLIVSAPGFEEDVVSIDSLQIRIRGRPAPIGADPIRVTLRRERARRGSIFGFDGKPLSQLSFELGYSLRSWQPVSLASVSTSRRITTDASGEYRVPDWAHAPRKITLHATIPIDAWRPLLDRVGEIAAPSARLLLWYGATLPKPRAREPLDGRASPELPRIDLSTWKLRRLQIIAPDGSPARDTAVIPRARFSTDDIFGFDAAPRSDRRGRFAWIGSPRSGDTLLVAEGRGWRLLSNAELVDGADDEKRRIDLEAVHPVRVSVVGASGKPVAGAKARVRGWSTASGIENDRVLSAVSRTGLRGTSDANGAITMWMIARKGMSYRIRFEKGDRHASWKVETPGDAVQTVVLDS